MASKAEQGTKSPEEWVERILEAGQHNILHYREIVDEATVDASAVLAALIKRFKLPLQEIEFDGERVLDHRIQERDTILCTIGWLAEYLSHQEKISNEDATTLREALSLTLDNIRQKSHLSLYMTACWSVLKFDEPEAIPLLAALSSDVYTAIETKAPEGDESGSYVPRGYVFENDLLERLVGKLSGDETPEVQQLMRTIAASTVSEGRLRPRIRFAAQRRTRE